MRVEVWAEWNLGHGASHGLAGLSDEACLEGVKGISARNGDHNQRCTDLVKPQKIFILLVL